MARSLPPSEQKFENSARAFRITWQTMTAAKKVAVVDDHSLIREGMVAVIAREPGFVVCGAAADGPAALRLIEQARPDVLLLDLYLQNRDGLYLIKDIATRFPATRILVVSLHDENTYAERALRAGASGYLMKTETTARLIVALNAIASGDMYVSDRLALLAFGRMIKRPAESNGGVGQLTDRELHVFQLIGAGIGTGAIADQLGLSRKTVEFYREKIKEKLGYRDAAALRKGAAAWVAASGANR